MHDGRGLQTTKAIGLSTIVVANILLFTPLTLYVGNVDEFTTSILSILNIYLLPTVTLIALFTLVGVLLARTMFPRYLIILAMTSILLWIQGNLLVWEYGLLDGRSIDWAKESWRGWLDLGIWGGGLIFAMVFSNRVGSLIIRTAVAIFALQLSLTLFTVSQSSSAFSEKSQFGAAPAALDKIYQFSSKGNVLHIIADGFQSDIFEEIINDSKDGKLLANALDGFVFFKENMGAFPFTHMSIPAILSGKVYQNQKPREAFLNETIGGKSILNEAYAAGHEIDLAVPEDLAHLYKRSNYTNAYMVPTNKHVTDWEYDIRDAAKLFDLTLFRLSPHFLKKYVYNDQLWLIQLLLSDKKYMGLTFFSHTAFLRQLRDSISVEREAPVYKFIHLMLSHNPMVTNENCEYAGQVLPTARSAVKNQARCGLAEVVSLLEKMKELGIYDNTTIILMADHGAWVAPQGLTDRAGPDGINIVKNNPEIVALALPLMAIKQPGASGPLQTSLAFSWIPDTPATIASIMGLDTDFEGHSVFDLPAEQPRERRHYSYTYNYSEWTADYLAPMQELIVNGSALDSAAWRLGDQFYPKRVIKQRRK